MATESVSVKSYAGEEGNSVSSTNKIQETEEKKNQKRTSLDRKVEQKAEERLETPAESILVSTSQNKSITKEELGTSSSMDKVELYTVDKLCFEIWAKE